MIISLYKWRKRIKYMVLFVILAFGLYYVLQFISEWITPFHLHREPGGNAVKVFEQLHEGDGEVMFADRLKFFWWYGE